MTLRPAESKYENSRSSALKKMSCAANSEPFCTNDLLTSGQKTRSPRKVFGLVGGKEAMDFQIMGI